jgi:hypothetical protein
MGMLALAGLLSLSMSRRRGNMLERLYRFVMGLFFRGPVRLAIVRRYTDANGSFVGELYLERSGKEGVPYEMIGASLDTLPFDSQNATDVFALDTWNDFLEPMPPMTLRVGTLCTPADNAAMQKMVRGLPRRNMTLVIQNRFIEAILEGRKI